MPILLPAILAAYALIGVALFLTSDGPRHAEAAMREARGGRTPSLGALVLIEPVRRLWWVLR